MNAPPPEPTAPLGRTVAALAAEREAWFWTDREALAHSGLADAPWLTTLQGVAKGRSVLVRTDDQLGAALALIALDGVARRLVLCPPDFDEAHLPGVLAQAEIDLIHDGVDAQPPRPRAQLLDPRFVARTGHARLAPTSGPVTAGVSAAR